MPFKLHYIGSYIMFIIYFFTKKYKLKVTSNKILQIKKQTNNIGTLLYRKRYYQFRFKKTIGNNARIMNYTCRTITFAFKMLMEWTQTHLYIIYIMKTELNKISLLATGILLYIFAEENPQKRKSYIYVCYVAFFL